MYGIVLLTILSPASGVQHNNSPIPAPGPVAVPAISNAANNGTIVGPITISNISTIPLNGMANNGTGSVVPMSSLYYGGCGHVTMYWDMNPKTPENAHKAWATYANTLVDWERDEMMYVWHRADAQGRIKLLELLMDLREQAAVIKALFDKERAEAEEKKDEDKKNETKKDETKKEEMKKDEKGMTTLPKPSDKDAVADPAPAMITVTLPENAKLKIGGYETKSTKAVRTFQSPALEPGRVYEYELEMTLGEGEKAAVTKKTIQIEAGKETTVNLTPDK
jgi:uncharacterized protein (TIGR03000 family)